MLTKLFRSNVEDPNVPLTGQNLADALGGKRQTTSGEMVGTAETLSYSPVWSALDQISSDIARMPWRPYRDSPQGRDLLRSHPLFRLLTMTVDGGQTTTNIWLVRMLVHALLYGNAFAKLHWVWSGSRRFVERLEFIHSDAVMRRRENGQTLYDVHWNTYEEGWRKPSLETIEYDRMFHLQGLTISALGGLSLVHFARNTIGRQLAASKYGDEFFANSAMPQGFFSHPGNLSEQAQNRFVAQMERRFSGSGNRHKLGFLEEDMKWIATGISPRDALLIDAMKWGIPEVARFFSIPAHKLGDPSRQGWNTTEQENISYYNSTLGKWTSRLCAESWKLWDPSEAVENYTCFDTDELLRADTAGRYTSYGIGIQWGFLTRNEARLRENLPPLEGLDDPLTPVNMAAGAVPTFSEQSQGAEAEPNKDDDEASDDSQAAQDSPENERMRAAHRDVVVDQLLRMTTRVTRAAKKAAREPRAFLAWLNDMESEHGPAIREALMPAAGLSAAIRGDTADKLLDRMTAEFLGRSRDELLAAAEVQPGSLADSVDAAGDRLVAWCRDTATAWTSTNRGS